MNTDQLDRIRTARGFIAALDQSGGSTPKALRLYGIDDTAYATEAEMFDLVHAMRTRIITSPAFTGERILGAILFEMTMDREILGKGYELVASSPDEFAVYLVRDREARGRAVKLSGARAE